MRPQSSRSATVVYGHRSRKEVKKANVICNTVLLDDRLITLRTRLLTTKQAVGVLRLLNAVQITGPLFLSAKSPKAAVLEETCHG